VFSFAKQEKSHERERSQGNEDKWGSHSLSQLSGKPLPRSCDTLRAPHGLRLHSPAGKYIIF